MLLYIKIMGLRVRLINVLNYEVISATLDIRVN